MGIRTQRLLLGAGVVIGALAGATVYYRQTLKAVIEAGDEQLQAANEEIVDLVRQLQMVEPEEGLVN